MQRLENYILFLVIFLTPLAVLSISPNPYVPIKLALLVYGMGLVLLIKAIRVFLSGRLDFSTGSFDLPVVILAIAYIVSTLLRTPNKMEAFLLPGTTTIVVSGALLYYLINQLSQNAKTTTTKLLFLSSTVFSTVLLLAFSGILAKIPQLPAYVRATGFNPEGGYLPAAIFFITILPIGIAQLLSNKDVLQKAFLGVANAILVIALAVSVYNMLPGKLFSPNFPSFATSWSVSIDALKESPIFGVGPGNYVTAFSRYRPLTYNATDLWALKFSTGTDFYLTLFTETGLFGAAGIIFLLLAVYRLSKSQVQEQKLFSQGFSAYATFISLLLIILALAVFPATLLSTVLIFIYLSFITKAHKTSLALMTQAGAADEGPASSGKIASRIPALLVAIPIVVFVLWVGFRASRILAAEYKFQKSLRALAANDAANTYNYMRDAINLNPYVDRYRATYSRVDLLLANAIAQKPADQITDQDRTNITQLIQQAISEGKATVALNPLRAANWELLGRTYQTIIPLAKGSDQFAIQSLRQAVGLDPVNPALRIALGGIYYGQGDFENAVRVYELAVATKPDLANAHYNLAFAYGGKKDYDNAVQQMSLVLSLVDRTSPDYEVARKALTDLQDKQKVSAQEATQNLTPPSEAKQQLQPPLELPEGSQPPEAPVSPTLTPTP